MRPVCGGGWLSQLLLPGLQADVRHQVRQRHDDQAEHDHRWQHGIDAAAGAVATAEQDADRAYAGQDAEHGEDEDAAGAAPDGGPVDLVQHVPQRTARQHDQRQRDVDGVCRLAPGGEAPDGEGGRRPAGEEDGGVAALVADDGGDGEGDGDRLVDQQREQEELHRLPAAPARQEVPQAPSVSATPPIARRRGEQAGEEEDRRDDSRQQERR